MTVILKDTNRGTEREFDSVAEAKEKKQDMVGLGAKPEDFEIEQADSSLNVEHIDHTAETEDAEEDTTQPTQEREATEKESVGLEMDTDAEQELRNLGGDFTTEVKGTTVIKKKGLRVMQQRYEIDVSCDMEVPPEETDHTYARAKAVAIMPEGRLAEAHGSASVERGDDSFLLAEMADTRAKSRALSDVTGIGHAVVEEMQGVEK